ncbi:uncharacterized protein LOC110375922 [Helicoverpa armigera]|uniref:Uncharacterized protein n=1 Tax=Helicoverpa armigera TaxID=29058 RepID=A0A2W1BXI3_HELAM|nr:uncharacterized protein LOC110375922 [Helicoverpa armigera]PZC78355.1 hypothetical protein B5X24_HaOG202261 [Helicoverpa armigera]
MYQKVLLLSLFLTLSSAIKDDLGFRYISKVYEDCQNSNGFVPCLKKKAILFFDRAARMDVIPLVAGVDVVKTTNMEMPTINENDIEAVLPRNLGKDEALTEMLWDRIAAFANSRTVQLSLPKISGQDLNKGVEEGRGKMKKMMGMMMMGGAMKMAAMIPLAIAGLFVLAGKALIVSKIALLLSGIMLLKKLMSAKSGGGGGGGHDSHGWSSGGSSGGWDRRAYDELPYSAYKRE